MLKSHSTSGRARSRSHSAHSSTEEAKPNQQPQARQRQRGLDLIMPRHGRHPDLWLFFTSLWLAFFILFFLPWQTQDRQGWNFSRSFQHDLKIYKSFFSSANSDIDTNIDHPVQGQVSVTTTPLQASLPKKAVPNPESNMSSSEQTFIAIKPDGVQRGLVGTIISRFENRGYKLVALKLVTPGKAHLEQHYADLKDKPFFPGLVEYMNSGPIAAMVWEGRDAVKTGRTLLGATNPLASAPGTIRGDFAIDVGRNVCHGSDSVENAKKEIALWFKEGEVTSYTSAQAQWIYEKP
ncbi:nucleoside diphosphate kinase [Xylariaceae sp. FL0662B]|nr:nucleoside diphosphate kinase [Xylariaceae sp. FL0662B]